MRSQLSTAVFRQGRVFRTHRRHEEKLHRRQASQEVDAVEQDPEDAHLLALLLTVHHSLCPAMPHTGTVCPTLPDPVPSSHARSLRGDLPADSRSLREPVRARWTRGATA